MSKINDVVHQLIMKSLMHNEGAPVEAVGREGDVTRAQRA